MKDDAAAVDRLAYTLDVADVAGDHLDCPQRLWRHQLKETAAASRVVTDEGADVDATLDETLC
jgi:hypothetical protein